MRVLNWVQVLAAAAFFVGALSPVLAADSVYYVGGDKAESTLAAQATGATWVRSLSEGLNQAAEDLNAGGDVSVVIKVAAGDHYGNLASGAYRLPRFTNTSGSLLIEGGYDYNFVSRDPFVTPSQIVTTAGRCEPMWSFARDSQLESCIVDGLLYDTAGSNYYDPRTGSLVVGESSTDVFIEFNYLEINELVFENCVFMNAAHRVMVPLIRAATPQAEIRYQNCLFLNNRTPLKLDTAHFQHNQPARIIVNQCSFVLNWSYAMDAGTAKPAALEIGPAAAAKEIWLTNNLFHCNVGGAILAIKRQMPPLMINNNDFVGNGMLQGHNGADAAALIVSLEGERQAVSVEHIAELPAVVQAENNVSMAADVPLMMGEVWTASLAQVQSNWSWADYAPRQYYDPVLLPLARDSVAQMYGACSEKATLAASYRIVSR